MTVAIVRYNGGNIRSVLLVLARIGVEATVTDDAATIGRADRVIIPGVGEASSAMRSLRARGLDGVLRALRKPVLGICLGMQLLAAESEEGDADCLGIYDCRVEGFGTEKRIHVGWNSITNLRGPLFEGVREGSDMYFVHGFRAPLVRETTAECDYGSPFSAALQRDSFHSVQFHPEKSGKLGETILRNFLCL